MTVLPTDLSAFVRGVERRGVVFAQLQGGDAIGGDLAFAVAVRAFHDTAPHAPREQWPMQFWASLLASPQLRAESAHPQWPADLHHLRHLENGARAVLLLRLVGGLSESDAAAVLAIDRGDYRQALHQALPHTQAGEVDEAALHAMVQAIGAMGRHLPAERLAHLARLREAALQGRRPELIGPWPEQIDAEVERYRPARWMWPALSLAGLACVLSLLSTFYWPFAATDAQGNPRIRVERLSEAAPEAVYSAEAGLLTHRDFEQLAQAAPDPVIDDLEFYAWYAAQRSAAAESALPLLSAQPLPAPAHDPVAVESDDAP